MEELSVSLFDWDDANISHIAEHGVAPNEAEEALLFAPIEVDSYIVDGELRLEVIGPTLSGRMLRVVTVDRADRIRVVTAFEASPRSKRIYSRSKM